MVFGIHQGMRSEGGIMDAIIRLLVLAGLLLSGWGCGRRPEASSGAARSREQTLRVRLAPVERKTVSYAIKALGSLEAEEIVQITAEVEGTVSEVLFHEGDRVTSQTILARIDPTTYRLEAERAEAAARKAAADQERARDELARREALAKERLVSEELLSNARTEVQRLAAEAQAAQAALSIANEKRRRSEVRPPHSGVVDTRSVDTGQYVRVGAVLATLVDASRLRLRFKVGDSESLHARPEQVVRFRVAALGARDYDARIYHVGETADPTSRQVEMLAWVKNPGELKPGFFAEVTLTTETHAKALVVPEAAVQASEQGFIAYVVEKGRAHKRPVSIGLRTEDGWVEILSGLKAGQNVVVEGSDRIGDGVSVEAVAPAASGS
jgi:multidrug efflux system membrane fusion protein